MSEKTLEEKFRNSVGFQFNFVQFSGLKIEDAINHICKAAEDYAEKKNVELKTQVDELNDKIIKIGESANQMLHEQGETMNLQIKSLEAENERLSKEIQKAERKNKNMRTDWIQTFTGKKFFPLEPKFEDICIEDIAHSFSMQCRFVGHCKEFYSVAQHSTAMVYLFSTEAKTKDFAKYALLHDASEAYLSDLPRPLKYLPEFKFYRDAEKRLSEMIYVRFGLNPVEPEEIKKADHKMLCQESMSPVIMSPLHPDWQDRTVPEFSFKTQSPKEAKEFYLYVYQLIFKV